jgi:hypothetical protein
MANGQTGFSMPLKTRFRAHSRMTASDDELYLTMFSSPPKDLRAFPYHTTVATYWPFENRLL